jgi:hypothetical protein
MTVTYLLLLPSNCRLLCHLGVTLSVLVSVRPGVFGRCSKQTIFSLRLRGRRRRRSAALLSQSAYTEMTIPPPVDEETPFPSSDREGHIDTQTHRQEGDRINLLEESGLNIYQRK